MIAVIDYGRGNLGSVEKAFGRLGLRAVVTEDPRVVEDAEAVVLPGDGAFHDAMASLARRGLLDPVGGSVDGRRARRCSRPLRGRAERRALLFRALVLSGDGRRVRQGGDVHLRGDLRR